MIDFIMQPWPWYIGGPLIGLMVPALLIFAGKNFSVSSSFRQLNAICAPRTKLSYLRFNWKGQIWRLFFVGGIVIGGYIGNNLLSYEPVPFLPDSYFSWWGVLLLAVGGILVGFGTRYAQGCTSGHTIMGISSLQWPSIVASISFFIGGLLTVWVIVPLFS